MKGNDTSLRALLIQKSAKQRCSMFLQGLCLRALLIQKSAKLSARAD